MKAFVHKQDENGNDRLGTGIDAGMVTPKYPSYEKMKRHFLSRLLPGTDHVEAFHDWDHRYGKPDLDTTYTVPGVMPTTQKDNNVTNLKFQLGEVVATPGCLAALEAAGQTVQEFLIRHQSGDWGEVSSADAALNDAARVDGSRIMSAYRLKTEIKIWIISEAAGEDGKRASTCLLLPAEY
jgi:hypothetical protein